MPSMSFKGYEAGSESKISFADAKKIMADNPTLVGRVVALKLTKAGFRTARNKKPCASFVSNVRCFELGQRTYKQSGRKTRPIGSYEKPVASRFDLKKLTDAMQDLITSNIEDRSRSLMVSLCAKEIAKL